MSIFRFYCIIKFIKVNRIKQIRFQIIIFPKNKLLRIFNLSIFHFFIFLRIYITQALILLRNQRVLLIKRSGNIRIKSVNIKLIRFFLLIFFTNALIFFISLQTNWHILIKTIFAFTKRTALHACIKALAIFFLAA